MPTDFETWNGRKQMKKDTVPTVFPQEQRTLELNPVVVAEKVDSRSDNCDILRSEINSLKQDSFKAETALKFELQKKDAEISKLKSKCKEQSIEIAKLKKKISDHQEQINKKISSETEHSEVISSVLYLSFFVCLSVSDCTTLNF